MCICSHRKQGVNFHGPFFGFELPPLGFLLLLFEVEFTMAVTLPLELVFDIVVDDLDALTLAFGLFATDCMFDTVWLLANALPVPFCWIFAWPLDDGITLLTVGSSQKQLALPLPDGIDTLDDVGPIDWSLPHIQIDEAHLSSFFAFCCCFCWAAAYHKNDKIKELVKRKHIYAHWELPVLSQTHSHNKNEELAKLVIFLHEFFSKNYENFVKKKERKAKCIQ